MAKNPEQETNKEREERLAKACEYRNRPEVKKKRKETLDKINDRKKKKRKALEEKIKRLTPPIKRLTPEEYYAKKARGE